MKQEAIENYLEENGYSIDVIGAEPDGLVNLRQKKESNPYDLMIYKWDLPLKKPTEAELRKVKYRDDEEKIRRKQLRMRINRIKQNELYPIIKVLMQKLDIKEEDVNFNI